MKISRYITASASLILMIGGLSSCKGRTLKDVEPTGDTVEVVINAPNEVSDTTSVNAESNPQ